MYKILNQPYGEGNHKEIFFYLISIAYLTFLSKVDIDNIK
jgi:hypothetical protein